MHIKKNKMSGDRSRPVLHSGIDWRALDYPHVLILLMGAVHLSARPRARPRPIQSQYTGPSFLVCGLHHLSRSCGLRLTPYKPQVMYSIVLWTPPLPSLHLVERPRPLTITFHSDVVYSLLLLFLHGLTRFP